MSKVVTAISTAGKTYRLVVPAGIKLPITACLWGGGGGGGGDDSGPGGNGAAGQGLYVTFNAAVGDVIDIAVGEAGGGGAGGSNATGGTPGSAYIDAAGNRYGGGTGGTSGPSGSSGAGGGGGGATVLAINGTVIAVASGGGGGGGGGNVGSSTGDSATGDSSYSGTNTLGQNGENKTGDGGGGGGGGGGRYGGTRGDVRSGDQAGYAGRTGGSWRHPSLTISGTIYAGTGMTAINIDRYQINATNASGGLRTTSGTNGYAILEFPEYQLPTVKVGGAWKSVSSAFLNINSNWKNIAAVFRKTNGVWKEIKQTFTITLTEPNVRYGAGGQRT
jgi:hypothetical protein